MSTTPGRSFAPGGSWGATNTYRAARIGRSCNDVACGAARFRLVRRLGMITGLLLALIGAYLTISAFAVTMALGGPWVQLPLEGDGSRLVAMVLLFLTATGSFLFVALWRRTKGLGWLVALALPASAVLYLSMAFASTITLVVLLVLVVGVAIPAALGFAAGAVSSSSSRPVSAARAAQG